MDSSHTHWPCLCCPLAMQVPKQPQPGSAAASGTLNAGMLVGIAGCAACALALLLLIVIKGRRNHEQRHTEGMLFQQWDAVLGLAQTEFHRKYPERQCSLLQLIPRHGCFQPEGNRQARRQETRRPTPCFLNRMVLG